MTDTEPALSPGEPRSFGNGRYTVRRRLGAGNFATVYLAFDERLEVPVAVKLLSDRWSWEPEVRGRFVQEARMLRSLNDPRVVQIRDIAETEDGRPYLVMDLATEGTLEQRMVQLANAGARPAPFQLRVVARAIADALAVLHERRIAHRDIKPSNMLITRVATAPPDPAAHAGLGMDTAVLRPGERLMLGDLGLAKDLAFDSGITVGVGTAGYMAPEQSLAGGRIDVRADIYAASALLAQIASGEAPDPARRVSSGRIETGRPLPASIPPVLAAALLRGLDADPAQRPQTIGQWLSEVDAALIALETSLPAMGPPPTGAGAPAPPPAPPPLLVPPAPPPSGPVPTPARPPSTGGGRRRRALIPVAAVVVALLVIGIVALAGGGSDDPAPEDLSVELVGPERVDVGEEARWDVEATGAVRGRWSLSGAVQPDPAEWSPGDHFRGTWNQPDRITLTLTVEDPDGDTESDSITFDVVEPEP